MDLKEKINKLYNEKQGTVRDKKVVTLLKLVLVDELNDLKQIMRLTPIIESTLKKYTSDESLMLQYLTQEELNIFRTRLEEIYPKPINKLEDLITLVLKENETDIDIIMDTVPLTLQTIKKYMKDIDTLSVYLSKEEIKLFIAKLEKIIERKNFKLEKLIKVVLVDGETDLNTIQKKVCIVIPTIKKYAQDIDELKNYLSEEKIVEFTNRINQIFELEKKKVYNEELELVKRIFDMICHTRYLYPDICGKNFLHRKKVDDYLNNEEFMNREFPPGTAKMIKAKIDENQLIRRRTPGDHFVIEDRFDVMITKDDIHYLNQFDIKKLNVASYYLGTGANLDSVIEIFNMSDAEVLSILNSHKLEQILKPEYYTMLKHCISIEKKLLGLELNEKKNLLTNVIQFLEKNNFDKMLAIAYFKMPEPLFDKILNEIKKHPYASDNTKDQINLLLNSEDTKKVR